MKTKRDEFNHTIADILANEPVSYQEADWLSAQAYIREQEHKRRRRLVAFWLFGILVGGLGLWLGISQLSESITPAEPPAKHEPKRSVAQADGLADGHIGSIQTDTQKITESRRETLQTETSAGFPRSMNEPIFQESVFSHRAEFQHGLVSDATVDFQQENNLTQRNTLFETVNVASGTFFSKTPTLIPGLLPITSSDTFRYMESHIDLPNPKKLIAQLYVGGGLGDMGVPSRHTQAGLQLQWPINKKWGVQAAVGYLLRIPEAFNIQSAQAVYNFSNHTQQQHLQLLQFHYIESALSASYKLNPRIQLHTGVQAARLLGVQASYERTTDTDGRFTVLERTKELSQLDGVNNWDIGLISGLQFNLSPKVSMQIDGRLGLTSILQDELRQPITNRNHAVSILLKHRLN